jgi:adenylate cyclase
LGARRFDEALPFLRASVAAFSNFSGHYNSLISCCGHLGLIEEVQGFIATRNRMAPALRLSVLRHHIPAQFANRDILLEGMRKAGVPE